MSPVMLTTLFTMREVAALRTVPPASVSVPVPIGPWVTGPPVEAASRTIVPEVRVTPPVKVLVPTPKVTVGPLTLTPPVVPLTATELPKKTFVAVPVKVREGVLVPFIAP